MAFQGLTAAADSPVVAMTPVREPANGHLGCCTKKSQPDSRRESHPSVSRELRGIYR